MFNYQIVAWLHRFFNSVPDEPEQEDEEQYWYELEQLYREHLDPDIPIREMNWYWGFNPVDGLEQYFWTDLEDVTLMPNFLETDDEHYERVHGYPPYIRQGVEYTD